MAEINQKAVRRLLPAIQQFTEGGGETISVLYGVHYNTLRVAGLNSLAFQLVLHWHFLGCTKKSGDVDFSD